VPDREPIDGGRDPERALSGESGIVAGKRARLLARMRDLGDAAAAWLRLMPPRLARAARAGDGSVHVLGVYGADQAESMSRAVAELRRSRRPLRIVLGALDDGTPDLARETVLTGLRGQGKFENLNALLEQAPPAGARWVVVIDDDVALPRGFLDRFLFVSEHLGLELAQPALTHTSHAAWRVFRRRRWAVARTTRMVEIGPFTAFSAPVAAQLLPFPPLRMGWGLDAHWGALAEQRGWRLGVVDATPIEHSGRPTASGYDRHEALAELREFLLERPWIDRNAANSVVETHRMW
jgi:hypothetical protein